MLKHSRCRLWQRVCVVRLASQTSYACRAPLVVHRHPESPALLPRAAVIQNSRRSLASRPRDNSSHRQERIRVAPCSNRALAVEFPGDSKGQAASTLHSEDCWCGSLLRLPDTELAEVRFLASKMLRVRGLRELLQVTRDHY